jgi:two-component system CAI-1 autoinducer sensor kinase/phosphatase CqsS
MDMNMPGMSGAETTAAIRARTDAYAEVPIIALTSQSDLESVQACLAVGMNEVMMKPVHGDSLYVCLARQFAQHQVLNTPLKGTVAQAWAVQPRTFAPITDDSLPEDFPDDLLDEKHLEELVTLDLLDESFLNGIEQIRQLMARLATDVTANDFESTHATMHLLLGVSGNIGAKALHRFARQIYPQIIERKWPERTDWLTRICTLGERSVDALHRYYATAKAS